jgi:signal transduction histidine kinase
LRRNARRLLPWIAGWLLLSAGATTWLAQAELQRLREGFDADARIVHRLLSLRAVEHEAILATLALLDTPDGDDAAQRLPAIYPRVLAVLRREGSLPWSDSTRAAELAAAEAASRRAGRAWGLVSEFEHGQLWVVQATDRASHALRIDLAALVPAAEWPFAKSAPVRVELVHAGHRWIIQPGAVQAGGWRFGFDKQLTVRSQPFDVIAERRVGWGELPWGRMGGAVLLIGGVLAGAAMLQQQRIARRRAEDLLRLGQLGRLNAMGELAAGMAHELNQPLTAILANTRAAERLLRDEPPDLDTALGAMTAASEQARRAADVVARLRRMVERPGAADRVEAVDLRAAAEAALHLVEPRLQALHVQPRLEGVGATSVRADPVALDQIIHNLITNALQALEQVPADTRRLTLTITADGERVRLTIMDTGPGIPDALRERVFEPFYTTREHGLGLGLSLCETLAAGMDGRLELADAPGRGAAFTLTLPLAAKP